MLHQALSACSVYLHGIGRNERMQLVELVRSKINVMFEITPRSTNHYINFFLSSVHEASFSCDHDRRVGLPPAAGLGAPGGAGALGTAAAASPSFWN